MYCISRLNFNKDNKHSLHVSALYCVRQCEQRDKEGGCFDINLRNENRKLMTQILLKFLFYRKLMTQILFCTIVVSFYVDNVLNMKQY